MLFLVARDLQCHEPQDSTQQRIENVEGEAMP